MLASRHHDTLRNDTRHNNTNVTLSLTLLSTMTVSTKHNNIKYMLNVSIKRIVLSVIMMIVIWLNAVTQIQIG